MLSVEAIQSGSSEDPDTVQNLLNSLAERGFLLRYGSLFFLTIAGLGAASAISEP